MKKIFDYYKYEDEVATKKLQHMSRPQTFQAGLELSELALKMLFGSFRDRYKKYSKQTALNKYRLFLRKI